MNWIAALQPLCWRLSRVLLGPPGRARRGMPLCGELTLRDAWQRWWSQPVTRVPLRQGQLPKESPAPVTGAKGFK